MIFLLTLRILILINPNKNIELLGEFPNAKFIFGLWIPSLDIWAAKIALGQANFSKIRLLLLYLNSCLMIIFYPEIYLDAHRILN